MEGSSLTHGCVTKSTCDLRLSVKNVSKKRSQTRSQISERSRTSSQTEKRSPKSIHAPEFASSSSFPPVCRRDEVSRRQQPPTSAAAWAASLRCGLRGRGPAPPPPRPTTGARNVATGCGEAQGVDCLLQRVGLRVLLLLQLRDALLQRVAHLTVTLPHPLAIPHPLATILLSVLSQTKRICLEVRVMASGWGPPQLRRVRGGSSCFKRVQSVSAGPSDTCRCRRCFAGR
jgi:hypothetical protein